jgi:microcystin-dependent protein
MPSNNYKKAQAGLEDIAMDANRNNETFTRTTSTGGTQEITKLNARGIPVTSALNIEGKESVEDFLKGLIDANNILVQNLKFVIEVIEDIAEETGVDIPELPDPEDGDGNLGINTNIITSDDPFDIVLKAARANKYLAFDTNGDPLYTFPIESGPPDGPINPEDFLTIINNTKFITSTTYTFLDSDTGKFLIFTNTGDITVTTPQDLTEGWQAMILKAGTANKIEHITSGNATHVNEADPVTCSSDFGIYSAIGFRNTDAMSIEMKFAGEIDVEIIEEPEPEPEPEIRMPVGGICAWPAAAAPVGFSICNGQALSRTAFPDLFAAIGITYGSGDGSTTFNIPNYQGQFLRGTANGDAADPDRNSRTDRGDGTTGDNVGTGQAGEIQSHNHIRGTGSTVDGTYGNAAVSGIHNDITGSATSSPYTSSTGGNETRPTNIGVNWIIRNA